MATLIQLPPEFLFLVALAKFGTIILSIANYVTCNRRYRATKSKVAFWFGITFLLYAIATTISLGNSVVFYVSRENFLVTYPYFTSGNAILMTYATTALLHVSTLVFTDEKSWKPKILTWVHFGITTFLAVVSIFWSIFVSVTHNPVANGVAALTALTYLSLIVWGILLRRKMTRLENVSGVTEEGIGRLRAIVIGSAVMLGATMVIIVDYLLMDPSFTGYTWLSPLGYLIMRIGIYQFRRAMAK